LRNLILDRLEEIRSVNIDELDRFPWASLFIYGTHFKYVDLTKLNDYDLLDVFEKAVAYSHLPTYATALI
jgi:hypothetical protein